MTFSVPSKVSELGPILQKFKELGEFLRQNDNYRAEIGSIIMNKSIFLHIFTKYVEPIFQSANFATFSVRGNT